jgi:hypothetical protein
VLLSTTAQSIPGEALSLFLEQNDDGQVDSSVPIRWCISRATAEMIEQKGILDPQLVVVIEQEGNELERYVIPLEEQMHWIQFRRPGENVIRATIMWTREDADKSANKVLTSREDNGRYMANLIESIQPKVLELETRSNAVCRAQRRLKKRSRHYESRKEATSTELKRVNGAIASMREIEKPQVKILDDFSQVERLQYEFVLGVTVPEAMFAKEPPRWMKWLGTKYSYWNGAAKDQCDLRRRAIWTGCTLPFYYIAIAVAIIVEFGFFMVVGTVKAAVSFAFIVILLICGVRKLNYGPLWHPLEENPNEIEKGSGPSIWLEKKVKFKHEDGSESFYYEDRNPAFGLVNPPAALILGAIGVALYGVLSSSLFEIITIAGGSIFVAIVVIVGVLASSAIATKKASRAKKKKQEKKEAEERQKLALRKDLEQLACSNASREIKLSALPKERRTVSLRFQAVKAGVCKPFAR